MSNRIRNALTIDLEEWFVVSNFEAVIRREDWPYLESRVERSTVELLDLLGKHDVHATFFVLGWCAERNGDLIRRVADAGHEIASHGYGHQLVHDLTAEQFREDLERSLEAISKACGAICRGYRAPSFSLRRDNEQAWKTLADLGIHYDSSVFPVLHDRYGEPDAPRFPFRHASNGAEILEFPLSTTQIMGRNLPVAGGGYLRLYPYGMTARAIRRLNAENQPANIYLHPWEIDPGQPKPSASRLRLLRHRVGMAGLTGKLDRLMTEFSFAPMKEVLRDHFEESNPS